VAFRRPPIFAVSAFSKSSNAGDSSRRGLPRPCFYWPTGGPLRAQTSGWRPKLGFYACASHLPVAKWFVLGDELQVADNRICSSVEKTKDWITLFLIFPGSLL
jgi:hypothetical protein